MDLKNILNIETLRICSNCKDYIDENKIIEAIKTIKKLGIDFNRIKRISKKKQIKISFGMLCCECFSIIIEGDSPINKHSLFTQPISSYDIFD